MTDIAAGGTFEDAPLKPLPLLTLVVLAIVIASYVLGVNQARFLTREDFSISGNSSPAGWPGGRQVSAPFTCTSVAPFASRWSRERNLVKRYHVYAFQDRTWWMYEIPELDTMGQTTSRLLVPALARDSIALWLDVPIAQVKPPLIRWSAPRHFD